MMENNEKKKKAGLSLETCGVITEIDRGYRKYMFFWIGQLLSLLGSSIASFVLIWWLTEYTKSTFILGLSSLLAFGPSVLITPFAGVFVDRFNRKKIIAVADSLQALATMILIFLLWFNFENSFILVVLLGLTAFRGTLQAFHLPAVTSLAPILIPPRKLQRFNSWNYLGTALISLIGPVIAAFLLMILEIHLILWIDVLTYLVTLIPLVRIKIPKLAKKMEINGESNLKNPSFKQEFITGLSLVRKIQGLLPLLFVASLLNLLITPLMTLFPYYVYVTHNGDIADLAIIMMFFQGGMIAGSIFMSFKSEIKRKGPVMYALIYAEFFGYAIIAFPSNTPFTFLMIIAGMLIMGCCLPIANILFQTLIQQNIPLEMQGRVMSVVLTVTSSISPFGMFLSGIIGEMVDITLLFSACTLIGIVSLTCALLATDIRYLGQNRQVTIAA
ncbi:MAG: MFS transporter [Candidatus Hodarchaeales archaeon]